MEVKVIGQLTVTWVKEYVANWFVRPRTKTILVVLSLINISFKHLIELDRSTTNI